jgi:hypothetical protein
VPSDVNFQSVFLWLCMAVCSTYQQWKYIFILFLCHLNASVHHPEGSMSLVSQVQVSPHCVAVLSKLMADLGIQ